MMESKRKVPEIRFAGFEEEWNNCTLSNFAGRITRKNSSLESDLVMTISAHHGLISQMEFFNKRIASTNLSGYYLMRNGEFTYNKSYSTAYPWGAVKRLDRYEKGVVSNLYIVFEAHNIDSDFLVTYFDTNRWYKEVAIRAKEGARNHGLLNISADDFLSSSFTIPLSISEQEKIGSLFKELSFQISSQIECCEKLHKLKSALLTSLFPQGKDIHPRIRLNGFVGDWTEMKASDIFQPVSDKGHPELTILSASQELGMIPRSKNGIDMSYGTQNVASYKKVSPGQFVIHLRSFQGGFAHSAIEGITSPAYTIMRLKDEERQDDLFWKFILVSSDFIKRLESVTYGIRDGKSIKFEDFANLKFYVPQKAGQKAIADLLTEYDRLIRLNEQKLEKLRNLKQAMLDKMFV